MKREEDFKTVCIEDDARTEYVGDDNQGNTDVPDDDYVIDNPKDVERRAGVCLNCFKKYDTEHNQTCPYCGYRHGTEQKVSFHLPVGTILNNKYIVGVTENAGGFGIIYRAWDQRFKCLVAIKEYFNATLLNRIPGTRKAELFAAGRKEQLEKETERFFEEAQAATQLEECENFVHVYDVFRENGTAYMVMEYLTGSTLERYMKENDGRLPWDFSEKIVLELSKALSELHDKGIIHRDVSPDNIFICDDGAIKLIDLGAARFPGNDNERNLVIIKPGLAPPEQYLENDSEQGPWTDIYALAATFYWTITGVKPEESTDRAVKDTVMKPSALVDGIPSYLDNIILKGMDVHKELRFQSADAFRKALIHKKKVKNISVEARRVIRNTIIVVLLVVFVFSGIRLYSLYMERKNEALLEDTEITVWIPYEGTSDDEVAVYSQMTEEFQQKYPQVKVTFKPVEKENYSAEIKNALKDGNGDPVVFNNSFAKADVNWLAETDAVYTNIDTSAYFIKVTEEMNTVPLGIDCIVLYTNQVSDEASDELAEDIDSFIDGKYRKYAGSVTDYPVIQEKMPGIYSVNVMKKPSGVITYTDEWAVNEGAGTAEKNAALRLLSFWMSDTSQDILHVQNNGALPISKAELAIYLDINGELSKVINSEINGEIIEEAEFENMKRNLSGEEDGQ